MFISAAIRRVVASTPGIRSAEKGMPPIQTRAVSYSAPSRRWLVEKWIWSIIKASLGMGGVAPPDPIQSGDLVVDGHQSRSCPVVTAIASGWSSEAVRMPCQDERPQRPQHLAIQLDSNLIGREPLNVPGTGVVDLTAVARGAFEAPGAVDPLHKGPVGSSPGLHQ